MSNAVRVDPEQVEAAWRALQSHRGAANAVSRQALRVQVGISDRKLRATLHELVVTYRRPVGSLPTGGYFIITSSEEAQGVASFYRSYAMELLDRARAVQRAFDAEGQVALFP